VSSTAAHRSKTLSDTLFETSWACTPYTEGTATWYFRYRDAAHTCLEKKKKKTKTNKELQLGVPNLVPQEKQSCLDIPAHLPHVYTNIASSRIPNHAS
jgi:hypothetical protein